MRKTDKRVGKTEEQLSKHTSHSMTEEELITLITETANQVRDARNKPHLNLIDEDTRDIIQTIRFINKIKDNVEKGEEK